MRLSTIRILERVSGARGVPYILGSTAVYAGDTVRTLTRTGRSIHAVVLEVDPGAMYPLRVQHNDGRVERFNNEEFV